MSRVYIFPPMGNIDTEIETL